ncbi:MAG: glycerophosphodiester phosphodiesterase family protein [Bacteroidota bacterium]
MKIFTKYPLAFSLIFFIVICGCKKTNTKGLTNLNNNVIAVLGHRGSGISFGSTYPMNTLESIEAGIDIMGADGMEIDAQLTKDKQLILYHGPELSEITSYGGLSRNFCLMKFLTLPTPA